MDEEPLAVLEVVASRSRHRILALLEKGVDHPEELARKLKLRRQGVDKQLMELYRWGFVDRSAILPAQGRPRIVYRLSDRGREFLHRAESLAREYADGVREDVQRSMDQLEEGLAAGERTEGEYLQRKEELRRRYGRFLGK